MALCPAVMLAERDATDECRAIEEAALVCLRFTPSVRVMPFGLLLEVQSSVRLFGGRSKLLRDIRQSVTDLGLGVAMGIAPTAHGAWLLARSLKATQSVAAPTRHLAERLDQLPLSLMDSTSPHLGTLSGIGCISLGDLRRLPRSGVARRFGAAVLKEFDRAYQPKDESFDWFVAPPEFHARMELIARVETTEALGFAVKRLMAQLAGWLSARHAAVSKLVLQLHHERWRRGDQALTSVEIGLGQPSKDPEHLLGLVQERLARLVLHSPVEELGLLAEQISAAQIANRELFPTVQSTSISLNRLIEKLGARLGPAAITRVQSRSDFRPEKAFGETAAQAEALHNHATSTTARPSWLLTPPEALPMQGHRPVYGSPLALLCGPERIESGWWDDAMVERDYFIAENELGQLLWVYRERHPGHASNHWYLHGLFA